ISSPIADVSISGSAGDDAITVKADIANPGNYIAESPGGMESVSFPVPTSSLTIDAAGGSDTVTFPESLTLPGVNLVVLAEHIVVSPTVTIDLTGSTDGSLSFSAADSQTGSEHAGVVIVSGDASIDISGATLKAGTIDLEAASALTPANPTSSHIALYADSAATITATNTTLVSSGNTTLAASSVVTSAMSAAGDSGHSDTATDAAIAASYVTSTATTSVTGGSLTVGGDLGVSSANGVSALTTGDARLGSSGGECVSI